MLTPYPQTFPQEALLMMLDKIRGKDVPVPELVHGAWNVAGYGLSQSIGGGQIVAGEVEAFSQMSDEELISAVLKQQGVAIENPQAVSVGLVPWLMITRIAIKLLSTII